MKAMRLRDAVNNGHNLVYQIAYQGGKPVYIPFAVAQNAPDAPYCKLGDNWSYSWDTVVYVKG